MSKHPIAFPHHQFALTPPMGWNSWDSFGTTVTEQQTLAQAQVMSDQLREFGYEYIVVDIQWYEPQAGGHTYRPGAQLVHDEYGRLLPATNRFPSSKDGRGFKPLASQIHKLGLKFGVHLMRGIPRVCVDANTKILGSTYSAQDIADPSSVCPWNPDMYGVDMSKPGAQEYYDSVFQLFAEWGVDFVKVDDISRPYTDHQAEIEAIRIAIDKTGRPMVLSLSPGETPIGAADHAAAHANMWRISDDFWDDWKLLYDQFARCASWASVVGPGHWPDADMLPIGKVRFGESSKFTPEEAKTMMNLWAIFRSPLIMGGDLTQLDDSSLSLLTHKNVLEVNQRGSHPKPIHSDLETAVWTSDSARSHQKWVALFNLTDSERTVATTIQALFGSTATEGMIVDLWSGISKMVADEISEVLPPHGSALLSVECASFDSAMEMLKPVPINSVRLLDSKFKTAQSVNGEYLLSLDIERLLSRFYTSAGLEPLAEAYGGWESATISGHSLGHLLSGLAWHYAATGDDRHKQRAEEIVVRLDKCQKNRSDRYVGGIPDADRVWAEIRGGTIRSQGFDLNGIWVPWYTIHKLLAGLIDTFELCDNTNALEIATQLADWVIDVTKNLSPELWQTMLACEHGGINESLLHLYRITGETRFKTIADRFDHHAVLNPLREGKDPLAGLHGNTQVPKVIGLAVRHDLEGDSKDRQAAETFWRAVAINRSYSNGGNSNYEYFGQARKLQHQLSPNTSETCNTYNMLKLTRHVFSWQPTSDKFDFYERALYNHIFASQDGEEGHFTYYVPLSSRTERPYSKPFDDFWCCVGTGMENHARYGDSIYFHNSERVTINLFIPSRIELVDRGLILEMRGDIPETNEVEIHVVHAENLRHTIAIRIPDWVESGFDLRLNSQPIEYSIGSDGYALVTRIWTSGETLTIHVPSSLRSVGMPDNPAKVSLFYGPALLAAESEGLSYDPVFVVENNDVAKTLKSTDQTLHFETEAAMRPADLHFRPFWSFTSGRYSTYFDVLSPEEWEERKADMLAKEEHEKQILANTVDELRVGEMQPERDHNLTSVMSETGTNQERTWRHAQPGGFFEFKLKVDPERDHVLVCTFWGADFNRNLKILIDGEVFVEKRMERRETPGFFDEEFPIPAESTHGKTHITIRFEADRTLTPGLYRCRTVKSRS